MNPLIVLFRQGSNGPHLDHVQSAFERLEDWRMRMVDTTGIEPTRRPFTVRHCAVCQKPVWILKAEHEHDAARCEAHINDL